MRLPITKALQLEEMNYEIDTSLCRVTHLTKTEINGRNEEVRWASCRVVMAYPMEEILPKTM